MARFTLNIELIDGSDKDYLLLHTELTKHLFKETVSYDKQNNSSPLRPEYTREGNISIQDVVFSVAKASEKTGKEYSYTIIRDKAVKN
jgi:hypothetical protein